MMVFSEYFLIYLPMRYQLWRRWKSCILHYSGERLSIVEINIAVCSDENMCCSIVDSQPRRWTSSSCSQLLCVNHYQVSNTFWIFKDEFSLFPFFIIRVAAEKASKCDYNVKAGVVISALKESGVTDPKCVNTSSEVLSTTAQVLRRQYIKDMNEYLNNSFCFKY